MHLFHIFSNDVINYSEIVINTNKNGFPELFGDTLVSGTNISHEMCREFERNEAFFCCFCDTISYWDKEFYLKAI